MKFNLVLKGGPGSGHRGHAGRSGKVGGSAPGIEVGDTVTFMYAGSAETARPVTGKVTAVRGKLAYVKVSGEPKSIAVGLTNITSIAEPKKVDVKKKPAAPEPDTISPTRRDEFDVYTVGYGDKLPDKVFGSDAILAYSPTTKKVHLSSESSGEKRMPVFHGVLASAVGEHEEQDNWVRAHYFVKPGKQPVFSISTDFAGIGELQYSGRDPKRADAVAYRNMTSLFSILRRAGFPADTSVEWRTTSSTVTLPIKEIKSLRKDIKTTLVTFILKMEGRLL